MYRKVEGNQTGAKDEPDKSDINHMEFLHRNFFSTVVWTLQWKKHDFLILLIFNLLLKMGMTPRSPSLSYFPMFFTQNEQKSRSIEEKMQDGPGSRLVLVIKPYVSIKNLNSHILNIL